MKVTGLRKVAAATLAGTMALSFASCMLFGANKQEIIDAADEFAGTLVKQDAGKIVKLTNEKKDSDTAEELEMLFDSSFYSDDQNEFIKAVSDTIAYEVDEESVEVDKEEASIDVTFTMVDYEKALKDGDFSDIDDVKDALKDCDDTKDVKVTFEFEKDDDEWLISNLKDKAYGKLFDFYTYELDLKPDLTEIIDYTDSYAGSYYLDFYVYFTDDISEYDGLITFDVYYEGSLFQSGLSAYVYSYYLCCDYYDSNWDYLDDGNYTIVVYYGDVEIASGDLYVDNSAYETTASAASYTGDFSEIIDYTEWYYDTTTDGVYDLGTYSIEFDVYFDEYVGDYADFSFDVTYEDGTVLDAVVTPTINSYSVWCYYYASEELPAGEYTITVYDGPYQESNIIAEGTCEIK